MNCQHTNGTHPLICREPRRKAKEGEHLETCASAAMVKILTGVILGVEGAVNAAMQQNGAPESSNLERFGAIWRRVRRRRNPGAESGVEVTRFEDLVWGLRGDRWAHRPILSTTASANLACPVSIWIGSVLFPERNQFWLEELSG